MIVTQLMLSHHWLFARKEVRRETTLIFSTSPSLSNHFLDGCVCTCAWLHLLWVRRFCPLGFHLNLQGTQSTDEAQINYRSGDTLHETQRALFGHTHTHTSWIFNLVPKTFWILEDFHSQYIDSIFSLEWIFSFPVVHTVRPQVCLVIH